MSFTEILEIADSVKRTSHRVKNSGDTALAELGLRVARKVKKQPTIIHAKTIEREYLWILKEKYFPILPQDKILPTITSMAGYDDSSTNDNNNDVVHNPGEYVTVVENVNNQTEVPIDATFDAASAIDTLNDNAESHYTGHCAAYVRDALEAGGVDTTGHPVEAKDYGSFLEQKGFEAVENSQIDNPQKGDIVVIQPTEDGKHESGHIAMYNGSKWVSDTEQRDYSAGLKSEFTLYRH